MTNKSAILTLLALGVITSIATYFSVDHAQAGWFVTYWGIVGTNLSVLGIIYTAVQIKMLRTEAEIIKTVTDETREGINALNRFADVTRAMKLIQEIQGYARARKHEVAVMRLQELKIIIGQMKSFNSSLPSPLDLDGIIQKLNQIINGMEKDIESKTTSVKSVLVNANLERILDSLVDIQSETFRRN